MVKILKRIFLIYDLTILILVFSLTEWIIMRFGYSKAILNPIRITNILAQHQILKPR